MGYEEFHIMPYSDKDISDMLNESSEGSTSSSDGTAKGLREKIAEKLEKYGLKSKKE